MALQRKRYTGSLTYSVEDKCWHGKLLGITDLVMYEGETREECIEMFAEAVDDYIETLETLDYLRKKGETT